MAQVSLILEEREADIGGFKVGRLLPQRIKRSVGPFVFIDHMGPAEMAAGKNMDVLPHPHIGLSTLTYLFEGRILHRDSIGSVAEITPGAVNWMTAGKGVVHSERTPENLRNSPKKMHGLQIWVAMPVDLEDSEPGFHHIPAADIPSWENKGAGFRLIAGELSGKSSPVPVHSRLFFLQVKTGDPESLNFDGEFYGECAVYILKGSVTLEGTTYNAGQCLVLEDPDHLDLETGAGSELYFFGGEPFPEKRFINWNFVSSSRQKIDQAIEDWKGRKFPEIHGEDGFVPYPRG